MVTVIPTIIPESLDQLQEKMSQVQGLVDIVQIDVMDGRYTPEPSWPYNSKGDDFKSIISEDEGMPSWKELNFEVDLMVLNPEEKIEDWVRAGASRVIIHIESDDKEKIEEIVDDYRGAFVEIGLAIKPSTSSEELDDFIDDIDFVQFMGNNKIGFSGMKLDKKVLEKISEFKGEHPEIPVSIDIGVNFDTVAQLVEAGVDRVVSGTAVYSGGDPAEAIEELRALGT